MQLAAKTNAQNSHTKVVQRPRKTLKPHTLTVGIRDSVWLSRIECNSASEVLEERLKSALTKTTVRYNLGCYTTRSVPGARPPTCNRRVRIKYKAAPPLSGSPGAVGRCDY